MYLLWEVLLRVLVRICSVGTAQGMETFIIRLPLKECVRGGSKQSVSNTVGCYHRTSNNT